MKPRRMSQSGGRLLPVNGSGIAADAQPQRAATQVRHAPAGAHRGARVQRVMSSDSEGLTPLPQSRYPIGMAKKRPWKSPWRRKPTAKEWAETAQMMREYLARQPHAPRSPATREAIVQELIAVAREEPPVELPEQLSLALN
jgi:hypothetical protein